MIEKAENKFWTTSKKNKVIRRKLSQHLFYIFWMVYPHMKLPQDLKDDLSGHTSMMPFLWTVVINTAVFFAKYKYTKYGIIVHAVIAMIVTLITLATALPLLFYQGIIEYQDSDKDQRHQIIGVIIFIIIGVQILIGFFSKMAQMISRRSTRTIYLLGRIHRYLGYLILALSKIQVFLILGLKAKGSQLFWIFIGSEVFFFLLWIARSLYFPLLQHNIMPDYRRIKNNIKKVQILGEIKQSRQNLGVFANYVYNIQTLKTLHPAGRHIIKTIGERQFDRYLYGMVRSERQLKIPTHSHSFKALNLLGDPIARLAIPSLYQGLQMDIIEVNLSKVFRLSQKGEIYQVYLKNEYQQSFEYKGFSCLQQLGRFHSLTINKVTRLYTSIGCISEANITFLERIYFQKKDISIRTFQLKTHCTDFQSTDEKGLKGSDQLCFLIKKYQNGKLTSNLFEGKPSLLKLSCPRGEGLKMWQIKPGRIIIVAAGTGIYPFCDLIDLLFKYELLERIPSLKKQLLMADPLLKNSFLTQFKYTLYLSVNYIDDIHPLTFAQLNELNQTQKFLKLVLRVSNFDNSQRFRMLNKNIEFVKERFGYLFEQIVSNQSYEKILVCGPPSMNQEFAKLLAQKSIKEEKYMII